MFFIKIYFLSIFIVTNDFKVANLLKTIHKFIHICDKVYNTTLGGGLKPIKSTFFEKYTGTMFIAFNMVLEDTRKKN